MNTALLCPGPSLATDAVDCASYDMVVGVNRAVQAYRCDVWVFSDRHVFLDWRPEYQPVIYTTRIGYQSIKRKPKGREIADYDVRMIDDLTKQVPAAYMKWTLYSATAALIVSWWLGAKQIDVYGADMVGEQDFDGMTDTRNNRDEKRWERERGIWNQVADWLKCRGVSIDRRSE